MPDDKAILTIKGLDKRFSFDPSGLDSVPAGVLKNVSFELGSNEILGIVGPSGCGKSTLLRIIAGLEKADKGKIIWGTVDHRKSAPFMVFQDSNRTLFPWLTVEGQLAFALRHSARHRALPDDIIARTLSLMDLADYAGYLPKQLSGGMQQRVALARALVLEPNVLLLDEPFASLDAFTRYRLEDHFLRVRSEVGISAMFVTHDLEEAVYMSDRILVLGGRPAEVIEEIDIPFGRNRNQVRTKAALEFGPIRAHLYSKLGL